MFVSRIKLISLGTIAFGLLVFLVACKKDSGNSPAPVNCNPPRVSNTNYDPASNLGEFEAQLESIRNEFRIPGMSAAIAKGRNLIWAKGFGFANVQQQSEASPDTSFRIASLTKTFASTIIMQLLERGLLDLDTPVSEFGVPLENAGNITVRHLLTHTSEGVPGESYHYNGSRFALLDYVVESVSGKSFPQLLREEIIDPLQLTQTAPCTSPEANNLDLAQGYCPSGEATLPYINSFSCAAGLISSVRDYIKYSLALDAYTFLNPVTMEEVFTPMISNDGEILPYGLGWFVQTIDGQKIVWHYGWWDATSTLIIKALDKELAFVIMANTDMLSRPFGLGGGDITTSSIARYFLNSFVFGEGELPDDSEYYSY
jgi:CubicO group peptidase (beta-lactamase class C family)